MQTLCWVGTSRASAMLSWSWQRPYGENGVCLRPGFIYGTRRVSGVGVPLGAIGEAVSCAALCGVCSQNYVLI